MSLCKQFITNLSVLQIPLECQVVFCVRGVLSPLLANVYLHYALDLWAQQWRKKSAGEMFIDRYADDVIFAFQYRNDAERFRAALAERLRQDWNCIRRKRG
jgi:retron-type reverse transcriptase